MHPNIPWIIMLSLAVYIFVGYIFGSILDAIDGKVNIAFVVFWPLTMPLFIVYFLIKTIKDMVVYMKEHF